MIIMEQCVHFTYIKVRARALLCQDRSSINPNQAMSEHKDADDEPSHQG